MTRRFFTARPAAGALPGATNTIIQMSKPGAAAAPCDPATVDPNDGGPIVSLECGQAYVCPECPPVEANLWPLLDNFTDPDDTLLTRHVSDSGHTWAPLVDFGSQAKILSNRANGADFFEVHWMPSVMPPVPEYDIKGTLVLPQAIPVNANQCGMVARYTPEPGGYISGYFLQISGWHDNTNLDFELWVMQPPPDGWTSLGTWQMTGVSANQSVDIVLECRNAAKKVFVDSIERISNGNNAVTGAGRITMFLSTDAGEMRFDKFEAVSP